MVITIFGFPTLNKKDAVGTTPRDIAVVQPLLQPFPSLDMHEAETGSHRKDNLTNRPPYFEVDFCGNRYNIIGGAARPVFGGTQTTLQ